MFPSQTKILIADDMPMFRQMVKDALTALEYKNYFDFADGELAWKAITDAYEKGEPFQLIISDWNMPKLTGLELLKNVRKTSWSSGLPFVLLTGETDKNNVLEAIESKVSQYIMKPFTVNGLKEKLGLAYAKAKALNPKWVP